ncbi:MAG: restriction endonuclease subunit S [Bacteroidetes bacterium]|nr:restriction endonuclease subunit S [Bacteroidota bacterium]MBS1639910.1 restriction endonuclease subunit S [Bacteroidota bacterium]
MSEWKEYKLSEVTEPVKETYNPDGSDDFAYIGLEHIEQETLRLNSVGVSSDVTSNKFKFQPNDVLFGKLRPYFRKVVKPQFGGICSTDIWVFRAKEDFEQNFLYYFLASWEFVNTANGAETGTRMPRADWGFLKDTVWNFPTLPEQKAIAEVLSSLDDKIDLLHQNNQTLEQLAETLFRKWFVGSEKLETKSEKLGDVITVKGGTTPSTANPDFWNGKINWTSPRDLSNHNSVFLFDTERKITEQGLKQISSGLLPVGTVLLSSRAPIGYLAITEIPVAINQGYIAIICDKIVSNYFIYLWCKYNMPEIENSGNGSVFQEISKSTFKDMDINIPAKEILKQFDNEVEPFFEKLKSNTTQIKTLQTLRDTLLPKLMSGEVRVSEP